MVAWIEDNCPKCAASNFVYNGDPADMTGIEVEGIRCWKCAHDWRLDGFEEGDDEAEVFFELGIRMQEVK